MGRELRVGARAVCDGHQRLVWHAADALGFVETRQAAHVRARLDVDDFDRVVPERRHEQPVTGATEGQVIDTAFDPRQLDRPNEAEPLGRTALPTL